MKTFLVLGVICLMSVLVLIFFLSDASFCVKFSWSDGSSCVGSLQCVCLSCVEYFLCFLSDAVILLLFFMLTVV